MNNNYTVIDYSMIEKKSPKKVTDTVNHPKHYTQFPIEVIDMMIKIWGKDKVADYCEINAFKYQMRLTYKNNTEEDAKKRDWYLNKAKELRQNLELPFK